MALTDNLVSYYKLDESSGDASDSVGSITMTNYGTVTYTTGKINNGADGGTGSNSKQLLNTTQSPLSYSDIQTAFTISVWINPNTSLTGTNCFFGGVNPSNGTNRRYVDILFQSTTNTIRMRYGHSSETFFNTTVNPTSGTWYHVVFTYDGSTMKSYVNAVEKSSDSFTPGTGYASAGTSSSIMGPDGGVSSQAKNAILDEWGFWTRALSPDEVSSLYNAGNGNQYPFSVGYINTLVVAGGGGGSTGGGGAGGYQAKTSFTVTPQAYTITVGAGGAGIGTSTWTGSGTNGGNSSFSTITAIGGGGGGGYQTSGPAGNGGSGGGAPCADSGTYSGGTGSQGNNGGSQAGYFGGASGGGGGAGAVGQAASATSDGGDGGAGIANSISGSSVTYAGGGGGGTYQLGTPGNGGSGGGGNGASTVGLNYATAGTANTGGGGGGGSHIAYINNGNDVGYKGKDGGSGVVIIAFPTDGSTGVSTSSTGGTITTVGGNQIHTFTTSGTWTMVAATATSTNQGFFALKRR